MTVQEIVRSGDTQQCHGEEEVSMEVVFAPPPATEALRSVRVEHLPAQSCRHNKTNSPCRDRGTMSGRAN